MGKSEEQSIQELGDIEDLSLDQTLCSFPMQQTPCPEVENRSGRTQWHSIS